MEVQEQPKLKFLGVDITEVRFKASKRFDRNDKLNLEILPEVIEDASNPLMFSIVMKVNITGKDAFELSVRAMSFFELGEHADEKDKETFISINAPAITFPYVRSFVSTFTANLGDAVGRITMPPQFFRGEFKDEKDEEVKKDAI